MIDLEQEVEITCVANMRSYYKNKGYVLPIILGKFKVKAKDLSRGSSLKIIYMCDDCGKEGITTPKNYYRYSEKYNGKFYCKACAEKAKVNISTITDYINKRGYKLLS